MSVNSEPRLRTFKAEGAIRAYRLVKWGTADGQMLECDANEKAMGVYQGDDALAIGDFGEVAIQGGGAMLEVSETVVKGKFLTPTADGIGEVVDASGEFYNCVAQEAGVSGDIIGVEVGLVSRAGASDA